MLSSNISYPNLIIFLYFVDMLKEGFGGERKPKDRVKIG